MRRTLAALALLSALAAAVSVTTAPPSSSQTTQPARSVQVVTFANLGTPANGAVRYCSNCQATSPCTSGGTGAVASRVAGAWNCSAGGGGTSLSDSASLRSALSDETGTGAAVFGTSPNITTPTGIVKGDVGLGNVDNTSDATKNAASATLTNKTIAFGSNTVSGTLAQFNTAVTDADLARSSGTNTFTGDQTFAGDILGSGDGTRTIGALGASRFMLYAYGISSGTMGNAAGEIRWGGGNGATRILSGFFQVGSTVSLSFSGGDPTASATDVGLGRNAAGVAEINSSTLGQYRDLKLRGLQYTTGTRPTCDSTTRGTTWYVAGGAGVADTFELCRKDAADSYAWVALF